MSPSLRRPGKPGETDKCCFWRLPERRREEKRSSAGRRGCSTAQREGSENRARPVDFFLDWRFQTVYLEFE
jgi:hypothetical protein